MCSLVVYKIFPQRPQEFKLVTYGAFRLGGQTTVSTIQKIPDFNLLTEAQVPQGREVASASAAGPCTAVTHIPSSGSLCTGAVQRQPVLVHSLFLEIHTRCSHST